MDRLQRGLCTLGAKIRDLECKWKDFLLQGDWVGLGSLQTPDFALITHHGDIISRDDVAQALSQRKLIFHVIEPREVEVRTYGSSAIVLGSWQMKTEFYGSFFEGLSVYSSVWVDVTGETKCACVHSTDARLAAPWKRLASRPV